MTTKTALQIFPTPFKSSFLSIPPSPCSPRTPLTPAAPRAANSTQKASEYPPLISSAPLSPLRWVWTCHQCRQSYHLGTTRRCLEDGHNVCSGTTTTKAWRDSTGSRRVKRHRACGSEFDYQGWKAWGRWRRGGVRRDCAIGLAEEVRLSKDCWNTCDYPSECRWGKKFGVHTPVDLEFTNVGSGSLLNQVEDRTKMEIDKEARMSRMEPGEFWDAILASAERRRSDEKRTGSRLAAVPEEASDSNTRSRGEFSHRDVNVANSSGDVVMTNLDTSMAPPSLVNPHTDSSPSSVSESPTSSLAVDSLRALIRRAKLRRMAKLHNSLGKRREVAMLDVPKQDP